MHKVLPSRPNLRHLRTQAKDLLHTYRKGDAEALSRVLKWHPKFEDIPEDTLPETPVNLTDVQLVIAREYGFQSWPQLKQHLDTSVSTGNNRRRYSEIDETLRVHLRELGVTSVAAYRLWCYRNGLDTALDKTPEQRQTELDLFTRQNVVNLNVGPDHSPRRAEMVEAIFRGEYQSEKLSSMIFQIRAVYNLMDGDEESLDALRRLILYAEKYTKMLRPTRAHRAFGHTLENTYLGGFVQLARHHRRWLRPLEDWQASSYKGQFQRLLRHLLVKYDVPSAMDSVWFQGNTPEARRYQDWYIRIGTGQSVRKIGIPMNITKRTAHIFMTERNGWGQTFWYALRTAQVEAMGGKRNQIWEIAHVLREPLEHEPFWESVIYFFINNPMIETSYVEPIIDYIRHQKYVPEQIVQEDGTTVKGPPPNPRFSMKGRSAHKLVQQVDAWHDRLSEQENAQIDRWPPAGFGAFAFTETDAKTGEPLEWSIRELLNSAQLGIEGRVMRHCVYTFGKVCMAGEASIWSLQVRVGEEEKPRRIMTIAVDNKKQLVTQYRGKFNLMPTDSAKHHKKSRAPDDYIRLLRESARILRMWMDKEGLKHAKKG